MISVQERHSIEGAFFTPLQLLLTSESHLSRSKSSSSTIFAFGNNQIPLSHFRVDDLKEFLIFCVYTFGGRGVIYDNEKEIS